MDELNRLTWDFDPDTDRALAGTMRRVRHRRAVRRTSSAVLSLAIFGGGLALAWSAFDSRNRQTPLAGPTSPSPTGGLRGSTYCHPDLARLCVTKTGPNIRLASGVAGDERWALYGFRAIRSHPWPGPATPEVDVNPSSAVCFGWTGLDTDENTYCFAGHPEGNFEFSAGSALLDAPADPERALPEDPFRFLNPGDFGPSVGVGPPREMVLETWTPPGSHRVEITIGGRSVDPVLVGPVPQLRTDWRLIVAVLPRTDPAMYWVYDANGKLLWAKTFGMG